MHVEANNVDVDFRVVKFRGWLSQPISLNLLFWKKEIEPSRKRKERL
jgi:hypothetical protein